MRVHELSEEAFSDGMGVGWVGEGGEGGEGEGGVIRGREEYVLGRWGVERACIMVMVVVCVGVGGGWMYYLRLVAKGQHVYLWV
jgi:hypothetical protein